MNNSQSSDIFSETSVQFRDVSTIDIESYEALVLKIKSVVSYGIDGETIKPLNNFPSTLDDCNSCVLQGLDIITYLLEDSALSVPKLCLYLEETVCVLQITSNLIKYIIETMAVTCCTMRAFPTTTGNTILSVFSHCKESECIYGNHLRIFEKQLKDLFRNCHELQLTYLMALENHFIFDLTQMEEQDVLMETLDINLKIGELVQALDVKTMAEHWKAYIMICEKYSNFLSDRDICNKTTNVLVDIIRKNVKNAIEAREEDKAVIRSLKVASFSLKILLRLCKILKCISSTNYGHIVDILQELLLFNSTYYEITDKISPNISNIANTHLVIQSEAIVSSLASDENFIKYVNSMKINNSKDEEMLQYILLLTAIMKTTCTQDANQMSFNMIQLMISMLPRCHKYLNMGIKFRHKKHGLFEHLLIHSLSAATSLSAQYYVRLENILLEALLGTDPVSAVFCSNLWVLLCRSANSQLQVNTLLALIRVRQTLETNRIFQFSPQNSNLTFTIENVFKILQYPEKLNIYKQFSIYEERNYDICCTLKIRNLPDNLQMSAKKVVMQRLFNMTGFTNENIESEQLKDMIRVLELAATCEFSESDSRLEELLVNGWRKICPKTNNIKSGTNLDTDGILYYRFLCALAAFTESFHERISNRSNLVKILHVLSETLILGNVETITRLFRIYCELTVSQGEDFLKETTIRTLRYLLEYDEVRRYVHSVIISNEKFDNFFVRLFNKEVNLQEASNDYNEFKSMVYNDTDREQNLLSAADNIYTHRCIQSINVPKVSEILNNEYNFDTDDLDTSFDVENDHPLNKKAKLDTDVANILETLESEVSKLCHIKENTLNEQYKTRLRNVCDKLKTLT